MGSSWRLAPFDLGLVGRPFRLDYRLGQCTLGAELITPIPSIGFDWTHVVRMEYDDVWLGFLAAYGSTIGVQLSLNPVGYWPTRFPYGFEVKPDVRVS